MASRPPTLRQRLADLEKAHRQKAEQLRLLKEVVRTANSLLEPEALTAYIMERVQVLVKTEAWSLLLLDESGQHLVFQEALGSHAQGLKDLRIPVGQGVAGHVAATGQPLVIQDVRSSPLFNPGLDRITGFTTRSILAVPLRSRGKTLGVLELMNKDRREPFSDEDLETVSLFAEPVAVALENALLFQRVRQLSLVDDLTQLYNSRYLRQALEVEITRGRRYGYPVSVLFLDLDGFKQVNDRYGHLVGSETLKVVGDILQRGVRNVDVVVRYGGDEFTLILPNTDAPGALLVAERLRQAILSHDYRQNPGYDFTLSASFGIAAFPEHGENPEMLIQKADQAMYRVKESTKNRCLVFE